MTNKELRAKRIRHFFVEATKSVIETDGIDGVTLRKVAAKAGFNSATLYNYFSNLNHLISIALYDLMGDYVEAVLDRLTGSESPYELYQLNWFVYAEKSFQMPKEYYYLFFKHPGLNISEVYDEYFQEHPDAFRSLPPAFQNMCQAENQYSRDLAFLQTDFGSQDESLLRRISEMNILIHKAMLGDLAGMETPQMHSTAYLEKFRDYFYAATAPLRQQLN